MARIRTIKPEFWQNEQLAGISFHARLLAIALLNHADDRGLFLANPQLVRAACFPFEEDSKNVLGSLQELSRIGYIEVRDCDGKSVGHICKFLDHQRIDKPQKSKLADVFAAKHEGNGDSKSVPGIVVEYSGNTPRPEGNGKEGNGSGKGNFADAAVNEFFESWWIHYPRKVSKGDAAKAYAKALKTFSASPAIAAEKLLQASLPRLAEVAKKDPQFIPYPASWLNDRGWEDEIASIAPASKAGLSGQGPGVNYDPNHDYESEAF
jgi:hypothetical protein